MTTRIYVSIMVLLSLACSESTPDPEGVNPLVKLSTTLGDIVVELDMENAPVSVTNFMTYVDSCFYDSTIFHRVIPGFIIQGGQFMSDLTLKEARSPIICESDNGLSNLRGTLAVARRGDPNSGTCQYFINLVDNPNLDKKDDDIAIGYAVFGRIVIGMDVIDAIASEETTTQEDPEGQVYQDVPEVPILTISIRPINMYEMWF